MKIKTITTQTKSGDILNNTFFHHERSKHLGIVLPGAGYSCQGPALYYPTQSLIESGADVMNAGYDYRFVKGSEDEYAEVIKVDATNIIEACLEQGSYEQVSLIAKSVGTWSLTFIDQKLLAKLPKLKIAWLTPLWNRDVVFKYMLDCKYPSLHVIGSKDSHYSPEKAESLRKSGKEVHVIENADHSLDIENDISQSITQLQNLVKKLEGFFTL